MIWIPLYDFTCYLPSSYLALSSGGNPVSPAGNEASVRECEANPSWANLVSVNDGLRSTDRNMRRWSRFCGFFCFYHGVSSRDLWKCWVFIGSLQQTMDWTLIIVTIKITIIRIRIKINFIYIAPFQNRGFKVPYRTRTTNRNHESVNHKNRKDSNAINKTIHRISSKCKTQ